MTDITVSSPLVARKPGAAAWLLPCAIAAAALVLPLVAPGFYLFQATLAMIYAIALLGLNMLVGYSGQISLGHGAFFAVGAYTTAILVDHFAAPGWAAIPMAAVLCFVVGFAFGLPALRLEGHYLALATFALAVAVPQLLKWKALEDWTGGVQGILLAKPEVPAGLPLSPDQWLYLCVLAITLLAFVAARNLLGGRLGRALVAIREQPIAAAAMGVDVSGIKTLTFGISALYTGVAGALSAMVVQFVSPDSFNFFLSITLVIGVVIGGLGTVRGALYGAVFIQFVPNLVDQVSKSATWAIYGVLLIVVVFLMPSGIEGAVRRLVRGRR
ncbi:leucine/isoleucine/valine transporter permease subunit [Variovorax sp. SRS16]|uniref:branched-chain amino acid ABC transporter permease n=1 Tax=Variovorax sp. SRS16 TaxID=282217 RepID=UPI0013164EBA|nr:branched-chain amino acid ABC transporter permease [Variovorax sp. SRS16]VTU14451.1 leucine/isoleucine/valine transporter permease subunit [Variovorax sp. SRS16]